MKNNDKISVILPTFNEQDNIVFLVKAVHKKLEAYEHEILIIDDNSPDGTYQAVINENFPYVRAVLREKDPGLANSIRCGLEKAGGNIIVFMDSDFNHQPKYLPFMIQALSHYDCVSASRFLYGGMMDSRLRHILSWLFNVFVRMMTGGLITDSLYGYMAIRKEMLDKLNYDDIFWGYGDYCIRLMLYLQRLNATILQIPAVNGKRRGGVGNSRFFKVFRQYFTEVVKLTYKVRIKGNA